MRKLPKLQTPAEFQAEMMKTHGCKPHEPHKLPKDHPMYAPKTETTADRLETGTTAGTLTTIGTGTNTLTFPPDAIPSLLIAPNLTGNAPPNADWRAEYNANFVDEDQGWTGTCTAQSGIVAHQWCRYKRMGGLPLRLSAGYLYYCMTGDYNFKNGSSTVKAVTRQSGAGVALSSYYPQSTMLTSWSTELPKQNSVTDGTRRPVTAGSILSARAPDINQLKLRLAAGYPVIFGSGNHAMCWIGYIQDPSASWNTIFFAKDSLKAGQDEGWGSGFRAMSIQTVQTYAYDCVMIEAVTVDDNYEALAICGQSVETKLQ